VGDFTDGDETNHLPFTLAAFMGDYRQDLLFKLYYDSAEKEEFYHAEKLFRYVVKSLSFSNARENALASTALDKESFHSLRKIAESNTHANAVVSSIQSYLGEIYSREDDKQTTRESEKSSNAYEEIPPANLSAHLFSNTFSNNWERNRFVVGWVDHWQPKISKATIYEALKNIAGKLELERARGEFLDILYPLAYEFDHTMAFEYVCQAQINDYAWEPYFSDHNKARQRWRFIKDKYPERYLEFFQKTSNARVPLPYGVEFLLLFGDHSSAEAITESSIQLAKLLMADLQLSPPEWLTSGHKIDEIDILAQRLLWPSPLVRERTASALALLLKDDHIKNTVYSRLLTWIEQQKMESSIAVGLLPLIKAFYLNPSNGSLAYIDEKEIAAKVQINSVVIERLIEELSRLTGVTKRSVPAPYKQINEAPEIYVPSGFFRTYVQTFIAPIYLEHAKDIEAESRQEFIKQWAFTFDELITETDTKIDINQVHFYGRSAHDDLLTGFSSKISEAFRSSFLRVLQRFYNLGHVHEDFFLEYAYASLPVELSKWKIAPQRSPKWWPRLVAISGEDESITSIRFESPLEDLIKMRPDSLLLAAEGAVEPAGGWAKSELLHSFLLVAFGYKVFGGRTPSADMVLKEIGHRPLLIRKPSATKRPFHLLEDESDFISLPERANRLNSYLISPLVGRQIDLCIALWQYFRDLHIPMDLHTSLSSNLRRVVHEKGWIWNDQASKPVATYTDWLEGLEERHDPNMPIPHGQYLTVDKVFLSQYLESQGLRLGYLLRTTYRSRKSRYDKLKTYEDAKLLNVGTVITPA
jgi:hypothetical protein